MSNLSKCGQIMAELASDPGTLILDTGPGLHWASNSSLTSKDTVACSLVSSLPGDCS